MNEYSDRIKTLIDAMEKSSSSELFAVVEREINTRITAVAAGKRVYGEELYPCRIKIKGVVICSEYNVLKANYSYLLFAITVIKEKMLFEKAADLYKSVVKAAVNGLTAGERLGARAVLDEIKGSNGTVVTKDISQSTNIGRSVILNGLRKLECAGIIEMHSKGAGGTEVSILYSGVREYLE